MRAQSHVVGVALMLGLAVVALGTLTVGVGTVVESQATNADATRMAERMDTALEGVERTGHHSYRVTFADGQLGTEPRTLRIINTTSDTVVHRRSVDALVFESGNRRVTSLSGAVVRGGGESAWLVADPPIASSERNDVLVVGAPTLNAGNVSVSGEGSVTTTLRTNVSHTEYELGRGEFAVAIETETPAPFERFFERQNATTERKTFGDDDHGSVVGQYPGEREGYLVVHDLALEVADG